MITEKILLPSSDGITTLNGYLWLPDPGTPVKAVLQFVHGMTEYMGRYAVYAEMLTGEGYAVIGHDHLGHGASLIDEDHRCYFAKEDGYKKLLADMYTFTLEGKKRFPDVPNFILGHSMGSFLLRYYMTMYSREICGAIVMGTGWHNTVETASGLAICRIQKFFKGEFYRSRLVKNIALGSCMKAFPNEPSPNAWLARNQAIPEAYDRDPLCGTPFTLSAWIDFFTVLNLLAKKDGFENIRRDLPVLFISGADDPVGGEKFVPKVCEEFREMNFPDLTVKLYKNDRHEVLREEDGAAALKDIIDWMDARI